ncbi:MAG: hypothetical protein D6731_02670 [Planctomycetota bacterium]|nr:MAG: hypothetical protein D6731_02670 [Planctomycetota bacterium]
MTEDLLTFLLVCLSTAFVCTAIKEDEDARLALGTLRLLGVMVGGILGFAVLVQVVTLVAAHA